MSHHSMRAKWNTANARLANRPFEHIFDEPKKEAMTKIPTYEEALERYETPLDVFISRWEPVDSKIYKKNFREDLVALIAYIEQSTERTDKPRKYHLTHHDDEISKSEAV